MESERNELAKLFPNVAAQMRGTLSNLHLAAAQLAPAAAREQTRSWINGLRCWIKVIISSCDW